MIESSHTGRVVLSVSAQRLEDEEMNAEKPKWMRYLPSTLTTAAEVSDANTSNKHKPQKKSVRFQKGEMKESNRSTNSGVAVKAKSRSVVKIPHRLRVSPFAASTLKNVPLQQARSKTAKAIKVGRNRVNIDEAAFLFGRAKI